MYEIKILRIINGRSYGMVTGKCNSKRGANTESDYLLSTGQGQHPFQKGRMLPLSKLCLMSLHLSKSCYELLLYNQLLLHGKKIAR